MILLSQGLLKVSRCYDDIFCDLVKYIRLFNSRKIPCINLRDLKIFYPFQVLTPLQRKTPMRTQRAVIVLTPNS